MRKNIFGIAVAMFAMLSACETINTQEGVVGNGAQVTVSDRATLTASIGADTKTYLEWDGKVYKTRWAEYDDIIVVDQNIDLTASDYDEYYSWFEITEGVGESTATFVTNDENFVLPDKYVALYGEFWIEETGQWMIWVSNSQGRELYVNKDGETIQGFYGQEYPMVALGNGTSSIEFKNLCSVLKVNITGDGESLQNVKVESLDEGVYLSGDSRLNMESSRPTLTFSTEDEGEYDVIVCDYINFNPNIHYYSEGYGYSEEETILSSDPVECYIVLPAQTYPSGLKLTIQTDEGLMEVNTKQNLVFTQSELREIANISYETMTPVEDIAWYMEVSTDSGNTWSTSKMKNVEGMCVVEDFYVDMNTSAYICFQDINGIYYGCSGQYRENRYKTNTCISLVSGNDWYLFRLSHPGYYDIYLDPASGCVFLMSDGYTPDDLPTKEVVVYEYYNDIYNYASVNSYVKIHGPVLAKCNYGFIVAIDGYYYNNIYVYDPSNLCDVELGDWVDVCAKRADYRFLPELMMTEGDFCQVIYSSNVNYDPEPANKITDYAAYSSSSYSYEYISYEGTLEISGIYNNIIFDGVEGYKGSITRQGTDLSEFNGKKVYVEGYYAGSNTSNGVTYINIILKKIMLYNEDTAGGGTTEEILPGDSFPVSNPALRR